MAKSYRNRKKRSTKGKEGARLPWHRPPHLEFYGHVTFIITAACYEHKHIIGSDSRRMSEFEQSILNACKDANAKTFAWCILPNHYHLLVRTDDVKKLRKEIGKVHGRTARFWNQEDNTTGRQVWFNYFDRDMRSDRHYWATVNYIHNNQSTTGTRAIGTNGHFQALINTSQASAEKKPCASGMNIPFSTTAKAGIFIKSSECKL